MKEDFYINSIYLATEGEGIRVGIPQIFIRFQGCAVGCINCDSMETWSFDKGGTNFSLADVMNKITAIAGTGSKKVRWISITGGDPLHPKHTKQVELLTEVLKIENFLINIEAAGTRVVDSIFSKVDFISMDFKTPSTGVKTSKEVLLKTINNYPNKYQIKSVVADKKDFEASFDMLSILEKETGNNNIPWVITPCYEATESFPKKRFLDVIDMNEEFGGPFRLIGQQHKWLHGADKKLI
jgi:7-carboxy-7-deazaguanine synthase